MGPFRARLRPPSLTYCSYSDPWISLSTLRSHPFFILKCLPTSRTCSWFSPWRLEGPTSTFPDHPSGDFRGTGQRKRPGRELWMPPSLPVCPWLFTDSPHHPPPLFLLSVRKVCTDSSLAATLRLDWDPSDHKHLPAPHLYQSWTLLHQSPSLHPSWVLAWEY